MRRNGLASISEALHVNKVNGHMRLFVGMNCISFTGSIVAEKLRFLECKHSRRKSAINSAGLHLVWQRVKDKEIASLQTLMDSTFSN